MAFIAGEASDWRAAASMENFGGLGRLDLQPELAQEGDIGVGRGVARGEEFVAVEDGICPGKKAEGLAFARQPRAAGREPDTRLRDREPGDGDQPNEIENVERRL